MKILTIIVGSILFFIAIFSISINKDAIRGTSWVCYWDEEQRYADSLSFKDSIYMYYSYEVQQHFYGEYYLIDEFLFLEIRGEVWQYNFPKYVPDDPPKGIRQVAVITKNNLQFIKAQEINNSVWVDLDFKYNDTYIFRKSN